MKSRLNYLSGAYSCYGSLLGEPPTAQLLAQVERDFKETPALIQRLSLSQTDLEFRKTSDELRGVQEHVLRLHSNLLWEKVREIGQDASENKHAFEQRDQLFSILTYAQLPEDEVAPHAACVVDALRTFGARTDLDPAFCLRALKLMSHMPAAVIEKHIGSVMLVLHEQEGRKLTVLFEQYCLDVITKLSPEKLASLNLKPQIAAIFKRSSCRSERAKLKRLLRTIPDSTKA